MYSALTAEDTLAMVDLIAQSTVILVKTEIDGDILTRNWMEQTNYYLNMFAYVMQKMWLILPVTKSKTSMQNKMLLRKLFIIAFKVRSIVYGP